MIGRTKFFFILLADKHLLGKAGNGRRRDRLHIDYELGYERRRKEEAVGCVLDVGLRTS